MILLKAIVFSLALTLLFTLVSHLLPQVEGEAPQETKLDLRSLSMQEFVAMGKELFENKGACGLCHKPAPGGRAPDILAMDMSAMTQARLRDARYSGVATDVASYLLESMVEPSRYVVAGWGKKGSNDRVSPMPDIDKPPIQLSALEMDAIIAFLQAKDGHAVTVSLPTSQAAQQLTADDPLGQDAGRPAPAASAAAALEKYLCSSCHALNSAEARVGPGLGDVGSRLSPDEIRQSIVEPNAVLADGFPAAMPADFAARMTVAELEMIVQFLAAKK